VLADQIDDAPASIALLDMRECERRHFRSPQPATEKDGENRPISQAANGRDVRRAQERLSLPLRQSIADANSSRLHALYAADPLRQFRREQAVVGRLRGQLTNRRHSNNDGRRPELALF